MDKSSLHRKEYIWSSLPIRGQNPVNKLRQMFRIIVRTIPRVSVQKFDAEFIVTQIIYNVIEKLPWALQLRWSATSIEFSQWYDNYQTWGIRMKGEERVCNYQTQRRSNVLNCDSIEFYEMLVTSKINGGLAVHRGMATWAHSVLHRITTYDVRNSEFHKRKLRWEWSWYRLLLSGRMLEPRHNILSNVRADIRENVASWLKHSAWK